MTTEIFRVPEDYPLVDDDGAPLAPGWYWWACEPGCLPDGEAQGPHATRADAAADIASDDDDAPDDGGIQRGPHKPGLRIVLDNLDATDDHVTVTCADRAAALADQTIDGSHWEAPADMAEAYAIIMDRPHLLSDLVAEGYDVDATSYAWNGGPDGDA